MIICGVQRNRLAGGRQGAAHQQGAIAVSRPLGPAMAAPGAGDLECSSNSTSPSQVLWGREKGGWHPALLPCFLGYRKAATEEAKEEGGQRKAQALLGQDVEREGPGKR